MFQRKDVCCCYVTLNSNSTNGDHFLREICELSGLINELVVVMHAGIYEVKLRQLG